MERKNFDSLRKQILWKELCRLKQINDKDCHERRKDGAAKVEGREKVGNEFCLQREGGFCKTNGDNGSSKKRKAWEDAEMDPEIQYLIETIWEVDNCPPKLIGEITLNANKTHKSTSELPPRPPSKKPPRPPPKQIVYSLEDLLASSR